MVGRNVIRMFMIIARVLNDCDQCTIFEVIFKLHKFDLIFIIFIV